MRILIIQPPAHGLVSGGYVFNKELAGVLEKENRGGLRERENLLNSDAKTGDVLLIDSLYLGQAAPASLLGELVTRGIRLFLLAHYLPLESPVVPVEEKRAWRQAASRWLPFFEGILSTGKRACPLWARHFSSAPETVFLPPAVGGNPRKRTPSQGRQSRLRLVTVGALCPAKNQGMILDSLRALPRADFQWDLVGSLEADPAYTGRFLSKVRASDLGNRIHLHGCLPSGDCRQLVSQADCYVTASLVENFGMATAEALAMGIPVISFEVGDILEWVPPDKAGRILKAGDGAGFHKTLQAALTTPEVLRKTPPRPSLPVREWSETAHILKNLLVRQR